MMKKRTKQSLLEFDKQPPKKNPEKSDDKHPAEQGDQPIDVWVVDSHSLIFQVFHAIPPMTGPAGQPVAAIYGFCRDMLFLLEKKRPDYLICAFDMHGPTFRHEIYEDYKVTRDEMPEEMPSQIEGIRRFLEAMQIPVLESPGFEADDVLAAVAAETAKKGWNCTLVTTDKDCRQLITDQVRMFNVRKNLFYNADNLMEDWGIRPEQVVDFQALVGDPTDNVPGVPLIGPKIAKDLLNQFNDLEGVLSNADKISGKKRKENLQNGRDAAMLSLELVRLREDVPIEWDWDTYRVSPMDQAACESLCVEFGFRGLANQMSQLAATMDSDSESATDSMPEESLDYQTVDSLEALDKLVAILVDQSRISIDTETTHTSPRWADLVGVSIAWEPGKSRYIPVKSPEGDVQLPLEETIEKLRPILESSSIKKIGQNLKYDQIVLRGLGVDLAGVDFDTMVAHYLIEAGARSHGLDELSRRYLNHKTIKISELIGKGKNQKRMDEVPVEQVSRYACEDADIPLRLFEVLENRLQMEGLIKLFHDVEIPLIDVLAEMEFNGIKVDIDRLGELSKVYGKRLEALELEIYQLAGREFNIASPKQLAEMLFQERGLPVVKKTKTGPSTDAEVLEQLAKQDPLPQKIIEHRQYSKLKNTYIDALPEMTCPSSGRVHTSFNQVVAATGRLSSNDPNLQNIPIRTTEGKEIRSAFKSGNQGWQLVCADYSQIELRVLAHYSQDAALLEAYRQNQDIHASVAAEVYAIPLEDVSSSERRSAKAINFGIVYGQSAFGLAKSLDISKAEAFGFIDAYFQKYPGVDEFMETTLRQCYQDRYVTTYLGRRRNIDGVRSPEKRNRLKRQLLMPERTAVNSVIQGSAADIIKLAMIRVLEAIQSAKLKSKLLLQIHDELVFEAPPEEVDQLIALIEPEMADAVSLDVPLVIDIETGENWAECKPV